MATHSNTRDHLIGEGRPRIDGRIKVSGQALYAADMPTNRTAYAALVTSTIARGQVVRADRRAAEASAGVLTVWTHENAPTVKDQTFFYAGGSAANSWRPLNGAKVRHAGQIVGIVVAETQEQADEGARLLRIAYAAERPAATLESEGAETLSADEAVEGFESPQKGDVPTGLAAADGRIEAEYRSPAQHHNPIELYATTCEWRGDELTIYEPSQWVWGLKTEVADQIGVRSDQVRVVSPYVGGAFGSKAIVTNRTALVALLARELDRPVKLVVDRTHNFTIGNFRAETRHRVAMGARSDGHLTAYDHEAWELTAREDINIVNGAEASARMYEAPHVRTRVHVTKTDRQAPGFMRAPAEVPYFLASESALDELAEEIGLDPVDIRLRNDTAVDPISGQRFSSRSLGECLRRGREAFDWDAYDPIPGSNRRNGWLIGRGVASAVYPHAVAPIAVRMRVEPEGSALIETACHDLGTGAYTIIAQQAADSLGVPFDRVDVRLGDSRLPPGPVAGGSITTATVISAIIDGAAALRRREGFDEQGSVAEAISATDRGAAEIYFEWTPNGLTKERTQTLYESSMVIHGGAMPNQSRFSFGAQFVEVAIDPLTAEIRVPRATGAFAAGRILNERTARSQLMGGMIWGIGSCLHEATEIHPATARYLNADLGEYFVPVNADVPLIDVHLVPEVDESTPSGAKGVGELGVVGLNAAILNAIRHATGIRLREAPVRMEHLLLNRQFDRLRPS